MRESGSIAQQARILLVEDSPDDAALIEIELGRGGMKSSLVRVDSLPALRQALSEQDWDLVLSDFHLADFDADQVLEEIKSCGRDIPLIILSGVVPAERAVHLMKRGAGDFLNKDALARLVPAIEREIKDSAERRQRRHAEERVRILSRAVEQSPVSVVITDSEGVIEYVNPKFEEVTGFCFEEAVGRDLEFTHLEREGDASAGALWSTVRAGVEYRGEFCNRRRDGQLFWEHATVSPLKDAEGRIAHYIAVKEDITVRRSYEERLLRQANFDELTGLPNRVLMQDRLQQAIAFAHSRQRLSALLCIDLDRFKDVNDSLGHAAGDILLREAADRLSGCVREGDTLARLGGDEFLMILAGVDDSEDVQKVAERVTEMFGQPFVIEGTEHFITASIGITLFPMDGTDSQVLLRNADLAMYQAKELGRNGYRFFTQKINQRLQERLALEAQLRGAVGRGEMLVHYQPVVCLADESTVALEALVRWRPAGNGLTMPDQFIPVAEEMGLIGEIGHFVITAACEQFRSHRKPSDPLKRIAVNVSPRQLKMASFGQSVRRLLDHTGLPADCLELEITESVLLDDTPETAVNLTTLCDIGVRLSIDDFGTGYSSLGYLQRYPFDTLKVDRSFIAGIGNTGASRLVETIITMAHGLGLEVIAEGVETPEQLAFLRSRGCNLAQGFLFSRPVAAETLPSLLGSGAFRNAAMN
jgi:diguanylate cyclase (GGDEF)-like protein/PAS domain S-box-containing protein